MNCEISISDIIPTRNKTLRQAIYIAYEGKCFYTGRPVSVEEMHIDHVRPASKGGQDCVANYVLTCQEINMAKNGRHSDKFEEVVLAVNALLFSDKVVTVYNELVYNDLGLIQVNDFLREHGINPNHALWNKIRFATQNQHIECVKRVKEGKSRGMVLYRREDLQVLMDSLKRPARSQGQEGSRR